LVDHVVLFFNIVNISDFVSVVVAICGIGSLSLIEIVSGLHLGVDFGLNRSLVEDFGLSLLESCEFGWSSFLGSVGQFGLDDGGFWNNNNSRFGVIGRNIEVHLHILLVEGQFLGISGFVGGLFLGGGLGSGIEWIGERIHDFGADSIGGEGVGLLFLLSVDGVLGLVHELPIFLIFLILLLSDEIGLFLLLTFLLLFFFLQSLGLGSSNGLLLLLLLGGFLSFSLLLFGSKLLLLFLGLKLGGLPLGFSFLLFFSLRRPS